MGQFEQFEATLKEAVGMPDDYVGEADPYARVSGAVRKRRGRRTVGIAGAAAAAVAVSVAVPVLMDGSGGSTARAGSGGGAAPAVVAGGGTTDTVLHEYDGMYAEPVYRVATWGSSSVGSSDCGWAMAGDVVKRNIFVVGPGKPATRLDHTNVRCMTVTTGKVRTDVLFAEDPTLPLKFADAPMFTGSIAGISDDGFEIYGIVPAGAKSVRVTVEGKPDIKADAVETKTAADVRYFIARVPAHVGESVSVTGLDADGKNVGKTRTIRTGLGGLIKTVAPQDVKVGGPTPTYPPGTEPTGPVGGYYQRFIPIEGTADPAVTGTVS
ncbi:hypothetical protein [Yinghuangia seranimata]|uniref:hypothetical protein n=1 Tax=Yinghuangia seranimata TaxID=408067 RepID=UPI00248C6BCC|nr:hypothetical protein [Yinghuangia seranimata]MDI2127346.1 hypothetical protein [Yinghuangia seranimata]